MRIKGNSHIVLSSYELSTAHTVPMRWPSPCVRNKIIYSSTTSSSSSAKKKKKTILSVHYILYLFPSFFVGASARSRSPFCFIFYFFGSQIWKMYEEKIKPRALLCIALAMWWFAFEFERQLRRQQLVPRAQWSVFRCSCTRYQTIFTLFLIGVPFFIIMLLFSIDI